MSCCFSVSCSPLRPHTSINTIRHLMASAALAQAFADDWAWECLDNPEFASQAGAHDTAWLNHLQHVNPAAYAARAVHSRQMAARLATILQQSEQLSKAEKICAELVYAQHIDLAHDIEHVKSYLIPLNSIGAGGVQFSFLESLEWMRLETRADLEVVLARLHACPLQLNEFIQAMREGLSSGFVASAPMMRKVDGHLTRLSDQSISFDELTPALALADKLEAADLRTQIETAAIACKEAFATILKFIRDEYMPNLRPLPAFSSLPSGAAGYEACLKYHTTTNLSAQEIHDMGLQEVARIEARYASEVCAPLGFADFSSFLAHAKSQPQFFKQDAAELLQHYRNVTARIADVLPAYFNEFPKSPMEIVSADKGPCAYYLAGTADGTRPGRFYVNCGNLSGKPIYEAMALALHEGIPGHHHQVSLALENETLPKVLRHVEDRRYEVCPCRRPLFSAYVEGWALYCEYLGEEMKLYDTPYDLFGRLSMDMMRAVRLVVDTGIHAQGWTIERALDYFMSKTGMGRVESENEIYRYASWPGQAVAYKVGQLQILSLRRRCETALGAQFDIKGFHSLCLNSGALTLSLLSNMVDEWISSQL